MARSRNRNGLYIVLFLLPVLILFVLFFVFPLFFTAQTSVMKWKGIGDMEFIGLRNFERLFTDDTFQMALGNNLIWALASGFIQVPLALLVAILLNRKPKGWGAFRTIFFLPNVISAVAIAMMWTQVYNPNHGLLNALLAPIFPDLAHYHWLGVPATALAAIIAQSVLYIGYFMIILMAAATNIPIELYEAAELDGATRTQQEFAITIPMLRGTLVTSATLAMAYGIRHFEATFLMTGGGPAYSTTTMGIVLFQQMDELQYGRAGAVALILIAFGTGMIVLLRAIFGSKDPMSDASQ
ncbi:MAG: sugar ABC transporter permease [Spirochaetales bacterium]